MKNPATEAKQQAILRQIRADLGRSRLYSSDFVLRRCEIAYGRSIPTRTWLLWRRSVGAGADQLMGGVSEATYLLLLARAALLRGNGGVKGGAKLRVPLERLAEVVRVIISGDRPWDVPPVISYGDLMRLIELRSLRTYTERHLRNQGLKRSQHFYSRAQAVQILSNFPDYSYVFQNPENQQPRTAAARRILGRH